MKSRLLIALAAIAAILGAVIVPATQAEAAGSGVVTVQLSTPSGADWKKSSITVEVRGVNRSFYSSGHTNSAGRVVFHLSKGTYRFTAATYLNPQYYRYAAGTSAVIGVASGDRKIIGVKVPLGASISGTLTTSKGKPLANAYVAITKPDGVVYGYSTTDKKGHYTIHGIATGKYRIDFNWRDWVDSGPKTKAARDWGWKWYHGPNFITAASVQVSQATSHSRATALRRIDGKVGYLETSITATKTTGDASAKLLLNRITGKSHYSAVESIYAKFDKKTVKLGLMKGLHYKVGIQYGDVQFWWQGDGKPLTRNSSKATMITSGDVLHVTFPAIPSN